MTFAHPAASPIEGGTDGTVGTADVGPRLVAVVLAVAIAVTVTLAAYVYAGAPYAIMAVATWGIALGAWLSTTFRRRRAAPDAFNLYIGTLVALMALYSEEWYRHFPSQLMRFYPSAYPPGVGIGDRAFVAVFPLAASAFMTLGALAYYRRTWIGEFAAWTVFAWGCVAAVAVYLVGPVAGRGTEYVGGMITAPLPLVVALAGMARLVRQPREVSA